jgi:riboflavin synthase
MFTGIIEEIGTVRSVRHGGTSVSLEVEAGTVVEATRVGESINTDGVCLTVTSLGENRFTADVMPETMNRTTFQKLKPGSRVNLERALRLSDRLGGHLVSGHIDGTGRILERRKMENAEWFRISAEPGVMKFIVEKGSVALDGISLTVIDAEPASFTVGIIPHTRGETTIFDKQAGSVVNIECDIIGKYVEKLIRGGGTGKGITLDQLAKNGFI